MHDWTLSVANRSVSCPGTLAAAFMRLPGKGNQPFRTIPTNNKSDAD